MSARPATAARGFTLIELLVTVAIVAVLALMAAPLTIDWVHGARTLQARGTLVQAYASAKALALRNPCEAPNASGASAATLEADTDGATSRCACARKAPPAAATWPRTPTRNGKAGCPMAWP